MIKVGDSSGEQGEDKARQDKAAEGGRRDAAAAGGRAVRRTYGNLSP